MHDSRRKKARGHWNLSPRDHSSHQAVSGNPVTIHIFLGSCTVHICQECDSLRQAPLRRCMVHLGLCLCGASRRLSGLDLGRARHSIVATLVWFIHREHCQTHASGICLQCPSLSKAQLSKWAQISDHFPPPHVRTEIRQWKETCKQRRPTSAKKRKGTSPEMAGATD